MVPCEVGRHEDARDLFEEMVADDFAAMPRNANWHVIADLAEACALLGDAPLPVKVILRLFRGRHTRLATLALGPTRLPAAV